MIVPDEQIKPVLSMQLAIEALEKALNEYSHGTAKIAPRSMIPTPNGIFRAMIASIPGMGVVGSKQGFRVSEQVGDKGPAKRSETVSLYNYDTGDLIAVIRSHMIDEMRTGASGAIGAKYLSLPNSTTVGLIGSGLHAGPQLLGVCAVRNIQRIKVYSRNPKNREEFCHRIGQELKVTVVPVTSSAEAVADSDIVIEATNSSAPVFDGSLLKPGCLVTSIGGGFGGKRQLDDETCRRAKLFVTGFKEEALHEGHPDILNPLMTGILNWRDIVEIGDIVSRKREGRKLDTDIIVFKAIGSALYDVAVGKLAIDAISKRSPDA